MSSKPIFLMAALTLIILLAVLYLGYELIETRSENKILLEQLLLVPAPVLVAPHLHTPRSLDLQIDSSGKVFGAGVVRDDFLSKDFQSCLQKNISRIAFPIPPSRNSVYVEHTFLFRKEDKK